MRQHRVRTSFLLQLLSRRHDIVLISRSNNGQEPKQSAHVVPFWISDAERYFHDKEELRWPTKSSQACGTANSIPRGNYGNSARFLGRSQKPPHFASCSKYTSCELPSSKILNKPTWKAYLLATECLLTLLLYQTQQVFHDLKDSLHIGQK